jgi:hypothetical protein
MSPQNGHILCDGTSRPWVFTATKFSSEPQTDRTRLRIEVRKECMESRC